MSECQCDHKKCFHARNGGCTIDGCPCKQYIEKGSIIMSLFKMFR